MKRKGNSKAIIVAMMPAVTTPVMFLLLRLHAPDFVVGLWIGSMIGGMILLLALAMRDGRRCDRVRTHSVGGDDRPVRRAR